MFAFHSKEKAKNMLEMFTDDDPMRADDYALPADGWHDVKNKSAHRAGVDMPCYRVPMKDGGYAFLCGDLGDHCSAEKCADVSGFLCDYPVGDGKTCDLPLCGSHAFEVATDVHYCYGHFAMWIKFACEGKVNEVLEGIHPFTGALVDLKRENEMLKERIRKLMVPKSAPVLPFDPKR